MPNVHKRNQVFSLIEPNHANIHVHTEFEKFIGALNSFDAKGRMKRIRNKKPQLLPELILLLIIQLFVMFLKSIGIGDLKYLQPSGSGLSSSSKSVSRRSKTG